MHIETRREHPKVDPRVIPKLLRRTRQLNSEPGSTPVAFLNVFLGGCSTTTTHGGRCGAGDQPQPLKTCDSMFNWNNLRKWLHYGDFKNRFQLLTRSQSRFSLTKPSRKGEIRLTGARRRLRCFPTRVKQSVTSKTDIKAELNLPPARIRARPLTRSQGSVIRAL